ncbi:hypothetical protein GGH92_003814 [Coemansia sp. RSA 2673]|nr:hypothetical protein GGH92_003814 [Coemansia sp. RSA 2673]
MSIEEMLKRNPLDGNEHIAWVNNSNVVKKDEIDVYVNGGLKISLTDGDLVHDLADRRLNTLKNLVVQGPAEGEPQPNIAA